MKFSWRSISSSCICLPNSASVKFNFNTFSLLTPSITTILTAYRAVMKPIVRKEATNDVSVSHFFSLFAMDPNFMLSLLFIYGYHPLTRWFRCLHVSSILKKIPCSDQKVIDSLVYIKYTRGMQDLVHSLQQCFQYRSSLRSLDNVVCGYRVWQVTIQCMTNSSWFTIITPILSPQVSNRRRILYTIAVCFSR